LILNDLMFYWWDFGRIPGVREELSYPSIDSECDDSRKCQIIAAVATPQAIERKYETLFYRVFYYPLSSEAFELFPFLLYPLIILKLGKRFCGACKGPDL